MPNKTCTAIVLRASKYSEHDKMLTLFSLQDGKISVAAKGAQSTSCKYLASTQFFCVSEFVLNEGKNAYVASAEVINGFFSLNKKLACVCAASYAAELTDKLYEEGVADENAFRLLYFTLCILEKAEEKLAVRIATAFALKLLGINGLYPMLDCCIECGETKNEYRLDYKNGGIVCCDCAVGNDIPPISASESNYLRDLLYIDVTKLDSLPDAENIDQKYLFKLVNNYIIYNTEKNVKSFDMLYSL